MKKLSAILVAAVLAAVSAVSVFAAGINSSEQKVLDELGKTVSMQGNEVGVPAEYINEAENYFNTIDMTEDEATAINAELENAFSFLETSGAKSVDDLSYDQKKELLAYGQSAVGVIGLTMTYDNSTKTLVVTDSNGKVAFSLTFENKKPSGGQNGGTSSNPIKVTGAGVDYSGVIAFSVIGGVAVLAVAGSALYFVKTKKERA